MAGSMRACIGNGVECWAYGKKVWERCSQCELLLSDSELDGQYGTNKKSGYLCPVCFHADFMKKNGGSRPCQCTSATRAFQRATQERADQGIVGPTPSDFQQHQQQGGPSGPLGSGGFAGSGWHPPLPAGGLAPADASELVKRQRGPAGSSGPAGSAGPPGLAPAAASGPVKRQQSLQKIMEEIATIQTMLINISIEVHDLMQADEPVQHC